ncbi:terminase family protein [Rhizobium mongolense]|uniref:terminase large subunit domain-containing protein n=1 Tax=Rhizobium mongolense TaxID=57676 RepID=UPI0034A27871
MLELLNSSEKRELMLLLGEKDRRKRTNKLRFYRPYSKQREFHLAGATMSERLFMAGNQLGKTIAGGAEWAMHLTGRYPDWWNGAEFIRAPLLWAGSVTGESTRDNPQRILVGPPAIEEQWGTGFIPADCIVDRTRAMGVPDLLDNVVVRWGGGGDVQANQSIVAFKAYEKGREKWQGPTVDGVWFDEEPPEDIYSEGLTRTNNGQRGQFAQTTFTPLLGMSTVVARFIMPAADDIASVHRQVTSMTIDDAEHYTPEQRAQIIASYPAHEREARSKGVPTLGSGLIFPVLEENIIVEPFAIPKHWPQIGGLDFGWDHPTAAAHLAWDRDSDVVYLTKDYRQSHATPILHAAALKPWGAWLPWAWPHDGNNDTAAGPNLAAQYRAQGLKVLPERASFPDGSNSVEAGLMDMLDRMQTGRFKVFRTCGAWQEERRLYHRKDGKVVKERDDVISASRYALMMLRKAIVQPNATSWDFTAQKVV